MTHHISNAAAMAARRSKPGLRHVALAAAVAAGSLLAASVTHAAVSAPVGADPAGSLAGTTYGTAGSMFQFDPLLFVQGLVAPTSDAKAVAGSSGNRLQFSASILGQGSGLMTIEYLLRNNSPTNFNQLRFVAFANPDGGGEADFIDRLSETWGGAAAGGPVLREGRAFIDPVSGINVGFSANGTLTEGVSALDPGCTALAGCDATLALQWEAATLAPGETFRVRVGLSDNGTSLSAQRFLTVTSVSNPATALTFSGQSAIVAVPEPGAGWLLAAGLSGLGFLLRRRQAA